MDEIDKPGVYLLMYWNSNDISDGAHYVAVEYDGVDYTTYNGLDVDPHEYEKRYIYGYYIE